MIVLYDELKIELTITETLLSFAANVLTICLINRLYQSYTANEQTWINLFCQNWCWMWVLMSRVIIDFRDFFRGLHLWPSIFRCLSHLNVSSSTHVSGKVCFKGRVTMDLVLKKLSMACGLVQVLSVYFCYPHRHRPLKQTILNLSHPFETF